MKKVCAHCKDYNLHTSKCMIDNTARNPDDSCDKKKSEKGSENNGKV